MAVRALRPADPDRALQPEASAPLAHAEPELAVAAADQAAVLRLSRALVERAATGDGEAESADARAVAEAGLDGASTDLPHRAAMEARFGQSFEGVRAHVGDEAAAAGRVLGADAYTLGADVAFAAPPSQELVAHELTHVVQQRDGRSGDVGADEREAEQVATGAAPTAHAAGGGGGDVLRLKKADPDALGAGDTEATDEATLSPAKIASAIDYNNSHWKGAHRQEILDVLRAEASGEAFEEPDVIAIAAFQRQHGAEGKAVDGKLGQSTMATLMRSKDLELSAVKVKPKDVKLLFYPGEYEDMAKWQQAKADALADNGGKALGDEEFDAVSDRRPEGHGTIYVQVGGNIVDMMDARGGPPFKLKDQGGHTADPSKAGTYKLGAGKSHTTSSWHYSQIAWGAAIRMKDGEIQYDDDGTWTWATGAKAKLKSPMSIDNFREDEEDPSSPLVTTWKKNDFGATAFKIEGSPGLFIHTTPPDEEKAEIGEQLALDHSHGCLHVQPSDRQRLIERGYLAKGVTIEIKTYDQALDMDAINRR